MGHATGFDYRFVQGEVSPQRGHTKTRWYSRLSGLIEARLMADSPPLGAARAYSYAYRALPLPTA